MSEREHGEVRTLSPVGPEDSKIIEGHEGWSVSAQVYHDVVADRDRLAREVERLKGELVFFDLHVAALAEIKATIDANSDQPVADIVYGLLNEIAHPRRAALQGET